MTDLPTLYPYRHIQETKMNTTTKSIQNRRMIAVTAVAAALFGSFAAVSQAADAPSLMVKYQDLNVSNPQGAATLYARIQSAAAVVCGGFEDRGPALKALTDACVHKAIADAVTQVGQPSLTALFNAKNGTPKQIILASGKTR